MGVTPTITIGSAVNNQILSALSTKTYRYIWSTSGVTPTSYTVSVSGQDLSGNTYAGSDKITIRLDSTAPTVTLSDTDDDNFLASSDTVTITTLFNEAMTSTPTISITGVVTNVFMLGGTASFTASDIATSADGAHSVFAADMDGDGDMDIVSASSRDHTIAWYENNGAADPSWTAANIATNAISARSVFAADMDGDGDMDIVSASMSDDTIAWYENNGAADPSWTAADIATSADGAFSVFAADMDGDGDMDIISASYKDDTIAWYENNGAVDPSWTAANIATSADNARSVFAADMDGDGDMDIVSASMSDDTIAWYENNGAADPSWTAADISTSAYGANSVYAADMDGDGDMDIISASTNDIIAWYENNGAADPTWTAAIDGEWIATSADGATSVFAADMDGDGDMDIISASSNDDTIAWYENNGAADPIWTAADIATSADEATSVYAADMDGDGDMDIISASSNDDTIAWYENGTGYSFAWDVDNGNNSAPSDGTYTTTVSGTDLAGNAYSGTDSITFTIDTTAPTVSLTDTDADNLVSVSEVVTITAGFSEAMTATPTISITGIVSSVIMAPVSGTNSYTYAWDTSSGTLSDGIYSATVSGTDLIGNAYIAGTQSITFRVDTTTPTVTITTSDSDNTIKPGDQITITATFSEAMASGSKITIGSEVSNAALTATNSTTFTYSWTPSGISEGTYTVTVTGTDLAGNNYAGTDSVTIIFDSTLPSVILGDSDDDNILGKTDVVTITALFSEAMTGSPTISISGTSVNNAPMSSNYELDSRAFIVLDANFPNSTIGNVIKDKGTNGNDFTLTNGTQLVQSSGENYYSFDGVNDNIKPVNYPNITNGISGTNFTFLFRIKFNSLPVSESADRFFTFNRSASTFANQFQLRLKSDGRILIFMDGGGQGGSDGPTSSSAITTGDWYNIAFVKNGISAKIYFNGVQVLNSTVANRSYSNPGYFYLGGNSRSSDLDNYANLDLSKFQAYNTALTLDDINKNFTSGPNSFIYSWDVDSPSLPSDGNLSVTVSGQDNAGNAYAGTDSTTFTLDTSAPSVILTDSDSDNIISTTLSPTQTVTITAGFSKSMTDTPTISISGVVTQVNMTQVSGTNSYTYNWNTSSPTLAPGNYTVTVSGTDILGNAYAGSDNIVFTISPTFYLDSNGVTFKCRGCNPGDQGVVNGLIYTAHDNTSIASKI